MVNPKKNPLMDLEVTEGSQKKAKMYRTAVTASPLWRPEGATWEKPSLVMDGEEMWPRSWWCCRRDPSREPCPAAGLAQQGKHPCLSFLPCCFTCYLTPPQKIHLAKAFKLCKHVWKKKSSQKCSYFQEKEQNRSCQGRKFVFYCHDRGRGPDQLEGLPMLWKISTDYRVSGKKIQKAANEVNLIRIFSKIAACSCHLVCLLYKCWYVQRTVRCPGPDCRKRTTRIGNDKCCGQRRWAHPDCWQRSKLPVLQARGSSTKTVPQPEHTGTETRRKEPLAPRHDGWQDTALCLCTHTFSTFGPFCSSLDLFYFFRLMLWTHFPAPPHPQVCDLPQAPRAGGRRCCTHSAQEYWLREWGWPRVFSLGGHRLQKSQCGTKREAATLKLNNKTVV